MSAHSWLYRSNCIAARTKAICQTCGRSATHNPLTRPGQHCIRHCPVCGPTTVRGGKFDGTSIFELNDTDLSEVLGTVRVFHYSNQLTHLVVRELRLRKRAQKKRKAVKNVVPGLKFDHHGVKRAHERERE